MTYTPLSAREWLEDMLRFSSRDADRARELLEMLDEISHIREEMESVGYELYEWCCLKAGLIIGDDGLEFCQRHIQQSQGARAALVKAGVLREDDETTDIVPLLQMFLPSE